MARTGVRNIAKKAGSESSYLKEIANRVRLGLLEKLLIPIHLSRPSKHWVCAVVNIKTRSVHFGDSFGSTNPTLEAREYLENLCAWLNCIGLEGRFDSGSPLAIGAPDDGHSCGICAVNALEHAVWPTTPLWTSQTKDKWRLQLFIRLVDTHQRSLVCSEKYLISYRLLSVDRQEYPHLWTTLRVLRQSHPMR